MKKEMRMVQMGDDMIKREIEQMRNDEKSDVELTRLYIDQTIDELRGIDKKVITSYNKSVKIKKPLKVRFDEFIKRLLNTLR